MHFRACWFIGALFFFLLFFIFEISFCELKPIINVSLSCQLYITENLGYIIPIFLFLKYSQITEFSFSQICVFPTNNAEFTNNIFLPLHSYNCLFQNMVNQPIIPYYMQQFTVISHTKIHIVCHYCVSHHVQIVFVL
jgi:hypothetical protein